MTEENGKEISWLLRSPESGNISAGRWVALGPYTYIPGRAHSPAPTSGTLTRDGVPVRLEVTEPVLQRFLDVMAELETNLARRWSEPQRPLAYGQASE